MWKVAIYLHLCVLGRALQCLALQSQACDVTGSLVLNSEQE